ncbi:MAG: deoxyribonuclease IV [Longicatena sp.]|nr:deoxyribonuclease IV [Longicatena sp.]
MKIGSHVSMSAPLYLEGSIKEALSYNANAFMLYTGAPQNTRRKPMNELRIEEMKQVMKEHNIPLENIIIHAPYIINLANALKPETFELGVSFLQQEIERTKQIGAKIIVLHPGSHVKAGEQVGLDKIVEGLDLAMEHVDDLYIALETMAGKGSELGYNFQQLAYIKSKCKYGSQIKVCMDTCHIHDAGYDIHNFDNVLAEFDEVIGLEHLVCLHINDSKNVQGARKDRHSNIGFGEIGYDALKTIVHHPKLMHVVKILETPYVNGNAPYFNEIAMLKEGTFNPNVLDDYME